MQDEFLSLLHTFVSMRTVPADVDERRHCLDWIQETFLHRAGDRIVRADDLGAPYLYIPHAEAKILLFAHIDIVPGHESQFDLRLEGDAAFGRGTKDMKGATLALLYALREAFDSGRHPPVSLLLTSDEETGGKSLRSLADRGTFAGTPVAYTPDSGEHRHIVVELKGAMALRLIVDGKAGHGAMPWSSENPIPLLMRAVQSLTEKFPPGGPDDWRMTVSPTRLSGSDAFNKIPQEASCTLDVRFPMEVHATPVEALQSLRALLPPHCKLETIFAGEPLRIDVDHPMVRRLQRIASDVTKSNVPCGREHGSSDARAFAANGIPAFLYGPTGGDLHGPREWVSVRSLLEQVEINRRLLREMSEIKN